MAVFFEFDRFRLKSKNVSLYFFPISAPLFMDNSNLVASSDGSQMMIGQSNDLLSYCYKMTPDALSLLLFSIKDIDYSKDWNGEILVYPHDYADGIGIERRRSIQRLKSAIDQLVKNPVRVPYLHHEGENRVVDVYWLLKKDVPVANDTSSPVLMRFNPELLPFLSGLNGKYTRAAYRYLKNLKTFFSFRLYQWLAKYRHLEKGKIDGSTSKVRISVEDMCSMTGSTYNRWNNFHSKTLTPAITLINDTTDVIVDYNPVRTGRFVTHVDFYFRFRNEIDADDHEEYLPQKSPPKKPRLKRKPKSEDKIHHWASENLKLLVNYEYELRRYNSESKAPIQLLRDIAKFRKIAMPDSDALDHYEKELEERTANILAKKKSKIDGFLADFERDILDSCGLELTRNYTSGGYTLDYAIPDLKLGVLLVHESTSPEEVVRHFDLRNEYGVLGWMVFDAALDNKSGIDEKIVNYIKQAIEIRTKN